MNHLTSIEPNLKFCKLSTGEQIDSIWHLLKQGLWEEIDVNAFVENTKIGELSRDKWKPVFADLIPLHTGMVWSDEKQQVVEPSFIPETKPTNFSDLEEAVKHFFTKYKDKHIGVQLSGGLDSSIIISFLH